MAQASYAPVKKAHVVPQVYQRSFAIDDQVAVHVDGQPACVLVHIRDAGTRPRFYRRVRPDGSEIDDIEASLSKIEHAAAPVLSELAGGQPLDFERKIVLTQFIGMQVARSPAFFTQDAAIIRQVVGSLDAPDFKPTALARFNGNVEAARRALWQALANKTEQMTKMITMSYKMASVLGHMRWNLVDFRAPLLAYSDQPVVMWPMGTETMPPFPAAQFRPATAIEVRMPLSPSRALLMTWDDRPDYAHAAHGTIQQAAEINAFTVTQADRQWMHHPGAEPPQAAGPIRPLAYQLDPAYSMRVATGSARRRTAERYLERTRTKRFLRKVEVPDMGFV